MSSLTLGTSPLAANTITRQTRMSKDKDKAWLVYLRVFIGVRGVSRSVVEQVMADTYKLAVVLLINQIRTSGRYLKVGE